MLVKFAKNKFRTFFEVSLWLTLIGCAICGAAIGYYSGGYHGSLSYAGGYHGSLSGLINGFWGLILGTLVGLLNTVIFGGLVAIFLNIDANVEVIKNSVAGGEQKIAP